MEAARTMTGHGHRKTTAGIRHGSTATDHSNQLVLRSGHRNRHHFGDRRVVANWLLLSERKLTSANTSVTVQYRDDPYRRRDVRLHVPRLVKSRGAGVRSDRDLNLRGDRGVSAEVVR
jgi:hypothetical protein